MDEKNETVVEEAAEEVETPEEELSAETDWEAEAKKARGIAQRLRTKLTKATEKKVEKPVESVKETQKTGGLDDNALDYLDLKGISEPEDLKIIEDVVKRTGQTVRQALKDDYVAAKLKANQESREVKDAMPGSSKRSSVSGDTLAAAIAKFEKSGELPDDFELSSKIVNAITDKSNGNKPSWH
jgi:hypothetical protein